jgi:protocatechuate 3,4-dioxygenase beta subunit
LSLFKKIANRIIGINKSEAAQEVIKNATLRRCRFEVMEERRVLSADPVVAGITYLEGDAGQDTTPDYFEVSFEGGAETTQLTQFTINGDQDGSGTLSDGDMFFDHDENQPGTAGHHEFRFDAANSRGVSAADIEGVSVSSDGLLLTVDVRNFEAGDVFAFSIDVDEVERFRVDKIASGVEFEATLFNATFVDENYTFEDRDIEARVTIDGGFVQQQQEGLFYDEYDNLFTAGEAEAQDRLDLTRDNEEGNRNRTAAAIDAYGLVAKPVSISGNVYHDENLNCFHDSNEDGIQGVRIELQRLVENTGVYESVAKTTTAADGSYEFGEELGLRPGTYRLVETQPDGYLDVGATAGEVNGVETGIVAEDRNGNQNVINNIEIELGGTASTNNDFKEVLPASLEGNVYHDRNDNGIQDSGEEGISNVLIQVTRVGAKTGVADDPFADFDVVSVRTDANGHYSIDSLPPGIYEIVEVNSYPGEADPLAPFIDGKDTVGNIAGTPTGTLNNDRFSQVELCADDHGVEYNFGELKPASISGYVSVDVPGQGKLSPSDPNFQPISGVTIQLLDGNGALVSQTQTDAVGRYEFGDLAPGTYSVVEVQPDGYLDGGDAIGNVDGTVTGATSNDRFDGIVVGSGSAGTQYNFCEHEPASIKGTVYHDRNNNGVQDSGEEGIAGVVIELFDADGNLVRSTTTDADGDYCFEDLIAGEYHVHQTQPSDYLDGKDTLGTIDGSEAGQVMNDMFWVTLDGGDNGVNYDFGELIPATISGTVHVDENGNCVHEPGEVLLSNVTIELLDSNGDVIATTQTDSNGFYRFGDLAPGDYSIREVQPDGYFNGGEVTGSGDGVATENGFRNVTVTSGDRLVDYNFCEEAPAEIHGRVWEDGPAFETEDGTLPENFRDLRDGVFQAGVDTPIEGVRMQLFYYFDPATDQLEPRPVKLSEVMSEYYSHLDGAGPDSDVWVETMADGEYWFQGLPAGSFIVLQVQPEGFADANDMPGPTQNGTSGTTFNTENDVNGAIAPLTRTFSDAQLQDTVANIVVNPGGISTENNFTEVRVTQTPTEPPIGNPPPGLNPPTPRLPPPAGPLTNGITGFPGLAGAQSGNFISIVGNSRGAAFQTEAAFENPHSWHLSVVNGGLPRSSGGETGSVDPIWKQAGFISDVDWNRFDMDDAVWTFTTTQNGEIVSGGKASLNFGMIDGIPVAGDFDGDGIDEVAVFKDGFWMIDINSNGVWDKADLLAKLGDLDDRPVAGDWDGDGKDDIGIYGPMWERDELAIEQEPGLPNPDNDPRTRPKNVPPTDDDATNGARIMKLTSYGRQQADVVDHVFGLDDGDLTPVTGDWNGNGVRSIGTFQDGVWELDLNGDGRFNHLDESVRFGRAGDRPIVGDFNGDGIEELAVYRNGTWIIDSNGNHELDVTDKTFELGGATDTPIAGDWDGDGTDEPAIYSTRVYNDFN